MNCGLHLEPAGIDEVSIDTEKGTLTVVGEVDPVLIVQQLRKIKKAADIVSVGPNNKPPEPAEPTPQCPEVCTLPPCCKSCQLIAVSVYYDDGYGMCSIL